MFRRDRRGFSFASWLALPLALSCSGTTPDQALELRTEVASNAEMPFENAFGWRVEIEGAWMSIGSLRLLEGQPLGLRSPGRGSWWSDWLVGTAHAHPGHFHEGDVVAEMLTPRSVDLRVVNELAPSAAVAKQPHSGKLTFHDAAAEPHAENLDGQLVVVVGRALRTTAEEITEERYFVAHASLEELATEGGVADVTGCPFEGERLARGGTLRLEVDVALWFDQVDFDGLEVGVREAPTALSEDPRASGGFVRGLRKASAYRFRFFQENSP